VAAPATFLLANKSWALLPDDDDEELVAKAKANRKARLQQDKALDREFLKGEGVSTAQENTDLGPVQKAIAQLAKTGSELESGNLSAAASSADGSWVKDFKSAAVNLSFTDDSKSAAEAIWANLEGLQKSAKANEIHDSKLSFVKLVDSLQSWVASAGLESKLRGL